MNSFDNKEIARNGLQMFISDIRDGLGFVAERYGITPLAKQLRLLKYNPYGGDCPRCMRKGNFKNIGESCWRYCTRCHIRSNFGNIFSTWKYENEEIWESNAEYLADFEVVP